MIQNAVGNPLDNLSFKDSRKYRKRLAKCEHNSQLSKTCSIATQATGISLEGIQRVALIILSSGNRLCMSILTESHGEV